MPSSSWDLERIDFCVAGDRSVCLGLILDLRRPRDAASAPPFLAHVLVEVEEAAGRGISGIGEVFSLIRVEMFDTVRLGGG